MKSQNNKDIPEKPIFLDNSKSTSFYIIFVSLSILLIFGISLIMLQFMSQHIELFSSFTFVHVTILLALTSGGLFLLIVLILFYVIFQKLNWRLPGNVKSSVFFISMALAVISFIGFYTIMFDDITPKSHTYKTKDISKIYEKLTSEKQTIPETITIDEEFNPKPFEPSFTVALYMSVPFLTLIIIPLTYLESIDEKKRSSYRKYRFREWKKRIEDQIHS